MEIMRAITVQNGQVQLRHDYPRPIYGSAEALIRVRTAGVCSTDLEIIKGYAGFSGVLGHEFVGDVVACADANWVGKRVVGSINFSPNCDGNCGLRCPEHCLQRQVLGIHSHDGAFADFITLPCANLLAVPNNVTDEAAVFTEPLAAAVRITEQVEISPGDKIAVIGPGRLGLLAALVLARESGKLTVLGRSQRGLELPQAMGLRVGVSAETSDHTYDLVVEATGNEAGLAHALRILRPQGTLVLKSTYASNASVDLTPIVVNELTVIGSRCGPFAPALALLAEEKLPVTQMIDGRYPLEKAKTAFEHAAQGGVRKILLTM